MPPVGIGGGGLKPRSIAALLSWGSDPFYSTSSSPAGTTPDVRKPIQTPATGIHSRSRNVSVKARRSAPAVKEIAVQPFNLQILQGDIDDLRERLQGARWPQSAPLAPSEDAWARGVPAEPLRELATYWREEFDWGAFESRINAVPQFTTPMDGLDIHFVHARSPHPQATPLLITHGWPSSFAEFLDVIPRLTDPVRHGGRPEDAFHVVVPSLPGFAFSGKPSEPGWNIPRTAGTWATLMKALGYSSYLSQGNDLGAWITLALAGFDPAVRGAHVNFLITPPSPDEATMADLDEDDFGRLAKLRDFGVSGSGYMSLQASRPQTLAYGLTDSPLGQLAWMYEKLHCWSDTSTGDSGLTADQILTQVSLYWLTRSAGSSANFYFENAAFLPTAPEPPAPPPPLTTPLAVATYLQDQAPSVRRLAEAAYPTIVDWSEHPRGGHFAALEQPTAFVEDLRRFRKVLDETPSDPSAQHPQA